MEAYPTLMQLFLEVPQKDMLVSAGQNSLPLLLGQLDHIIDGYPIVIDQPRTDH